MPSGGPRKSEHPLCTKLLEVLFAHAGRNVSSYGGRRRWLRNIITPIHCTSPTSAKVGFSEGSAVAKLL